MNMNRECQYIANKPHKWDFKVVVCAGKNIVLIFMPYGGKGITTNLSDKEKTLRVRDQVVVFLCETIPRILKPKFILTIFSAHLN